MIAISATPGQARTVRPFSINHNVAATTAGPSPIAANSQTPHATPTLISTGSTKTTDYLLVGALIVLLVILMKEG